MKVLLANSERGFRGGEHQTVTLAKGLLGAGIDVRAAVMKGSRLHEELSGVVKSYALPFESLPFVTPLGLRRHIASFRPDILHAQTSRSHTHLWLARTLIAESPPLVVSRRVAFKPKCSLKYRYGVAHYIPISQASSLSLSSVGIEPERMTIVPSGVDVGLLSASAGDPLLLSEWDIGSGTRLIGTIAALEREKGLSTLIEAADEIIARRNDCIFVLIGEGSLRKELEAEISRRALDGRIVIFAQTAPLEDILPLFDIYVQPSLEEGLSTALIAAAAAGLPIVASDTGGIPEVLGDDGGLLVEKGNAKSFQDGIARMLDEGGLREELSERARRRARDFDMKRTVLETISVYRRVLGSRDR